MHARSTPQHQRIWGHDDYAGQGEAQAVGPKARRHLHVGLGGGIGSSSGRRGHGGAETRLRRYPHELLYAKWLVVYNYSSSLYTYGWHVEVRDASINHRLITASPITINPHSLAILQACRARGYPNRHPPTPSLL